MSDLPAGCTIIGQRAYDTGTHVLISGQPNTGKTTSLGTWPTPMAVLVAPGEKGTASLPTGEGITAYQVEALVTSEGDQDWRARYKAFKALTAYCAQLPNLQTLAVDGIHKWYEVILNFVTEGRMARAEPFNGMQKYPQAGALFFRGWLDSVLSRPIPYVVMTVWEGRDKDDPDYVAPPDSVKPAPSSIWPELTGRSGRDILGEFQVALYAFREGRGQATRYKWQTQPFDKVAGAGIKASIAQGKTIPLYVPQDWPTLAKYLNHKETP